MSNFTPVSGQSGVEPTSAPKTNKQEDSDVYSLKGTFASVLMLGGFIIVVWLAIFLLFLHRQ